MAVICNLTTLNLTAPTNCQVRSVPCVYLPISNRLNQLPQGLEHHQFREHAILLFTSVPDESEPPAFLSYYYSRSWHT